MAKTQGEQYESDSDNPADMKKTGEQKGNYVASNDEQVSILFTQNRKFDLHVGREVVVFLGRETKQVPKSWMEHPDFRQVQKHFVVKGV